MKTTVYLQPNPILPLLLLQPLYDLVPAQFFCEAPRGNHIESICTDHKTSSQNAVCSDPKLPTAVLKVHLETAFDCDGSGRDFQIDTDLYGFSHCGVCV